MSQPAIISTVTVSGRQLPAYTIALQAAALVLVSAPKGFVMCGFLDIAAAEKLSAAACVVTGIQNPAELLDHPVVRLSAPAAALGITVGMSGRDALERMV